MKIFLRIIRVIVGLVLLAAFAYGLFIFAKAAPKGSEISEDGKPAASASPDAQDVSPSAPTPTPSPEPTPEPVPEPTPLPNTPEARAAARGLPAPPDIDIDSWEYMLVNADHSIDQYKPEQFGYLNPTIDAFDVQTVYNPNRVDSAVDVRIGQALLDMCIAAEKEGMDVYLTSCYRSYASQLENFQRVNNNNNITDGKDKDGHYITMPAGCSEHQTGLCADIIDKWRNPLRAADLKDIPLEVWLRENCQEYGFILRFPEGKEDITGVMYEPWHFRYVGKVAAKYIMENDLCLEEFVALYKGDV